MTKREAAFEISEIMSLVFPGQSYGLLSKLKTALLEDDERSDLPPTAFLQEHLVHQEVVRHRDSLLRERNELKLELERAKGLDDAITTLARMLSEVSAERDRLKAAAE